MVYIKLLYTNLYEESDHLRCMHCGKEDDTVENTLFICLFKADPRVEVKRVIGKTLQPVDIPDLLLRPKEVLIPTDPVARLKINELAEV